MFNAIKIGDNAKTAKQFTPVHPDPKIGKKHGVSMMLHGKHSEVYRAAIGTMIRSTKKGEKTLDEAVTESAKLIATCCESYTGDGDKKFDREALQETLENDDYRWMRLQAEVFMQDDDNFF